MLLSRADFNSARLTGSKTEGRFRSSSKLTEPSGPTQETSASDRGSDSMGKGMTGTRAARTADSTDNIAMKMTFVISTTSTYAAGAYSPRMAMERAFAWSDFCTFTVSTPCLKSAWMHEASAQEGMTNVRVNVP